MITRRSLLTTAAYAASSAAIVTSARAASAKSVAIGAIQPLTGSLAPFGQASLHGIELAVERINGAGGLTGFGGAKLKVITADAESDPTTAASATQRLISQSGVKAILGCYASSLSLAASPIAERNHIPFLTMSFSDELTSRGFHYIFQDIAKASAIGEAQLRYARAIAKDQGKSVNSIAILYENSAYGTSQAEGLKKEAGKLGVHVALFDGYPPGITDATPLVQKIKATMPKADAIFPMSYFTDAVLIVRALHQYGVATPVIGGAAGYVIPAFEQALGKDVNGILSADTSNYDHYGIIGEIYRKRYGQFMTHEAFENTVLVYAYAAAVNHAGTDNPEKVATALHSIKMTGYPFTGLPGGAVKFDEAGLNVMAYPIMVQWQKGELATVWPKVDAKAAAQWE